MTSLRVSTCAVVFASALPAFGQMLYWTNPGADRIQRAKVVSPSIQDVVVTGFPSGVWGIAIDPLRQKLYWTDIVLDRIYRANLDGSAVELLVVEFDPLAIAIDTKQNRLYWVSGDGFAADLVRSLADGTQRETLLPLFSPGEGIAVDSRLGKVYWSEPAGYCIRRANLDGSQAETFLTLNVGTLAPYPIALDLTADKIYWGAMDITSEVEVSRLQRANLSAPVPETIVTLEFDYLTGVAINPLDRKIYWGEDNRIRRAELDGSSPEDFITLPSGYASGVAFDVPADIPTLSTGSVLLLALLVLVAGSTILRRKKLRLDTTLTGLDKRLVTRVSWVDRECQRILSWVARGRRIRYNPAELEQRF